MKEFNYQRSPIAAAILERKDQGGADTSDPKVLAVEIKRIGDEVTRFANDCLEAVRKNTADTADAKKAIDQVLVDKGTIEKRLKEVEDEFVVARPGGGSKAVKSIGEQVIDSPSFKAYQSQNGGRVSIPVKALLSAAFPVSVDRQPGILPLMFRRLTVRDLIAPGRTISSAIEYVRETGFTNSAAIVAEGAAKPESNVVFELVQKPVATIAHWLQASKQILADAPMLQSFIDQRLRFGLQIVEENQLLKGSGSGGNLQGIYTAATAYAEPAGVVVVNQTAIDTLRLAILQAELAFYPTNGIVLSPVDWASIELTKTTEGAYLFANPQGTIQPRLWGRDVVATPAMDADDFLTGAFGMAAQIFDREDANVVISDEDRDNFIKNLVTIRAEERLGLAIYRPDAFIKGSLTVAP